MAPKNIAKIIFSAIAGSVIAFVFNFFILTHLIIPDPCYYHSHDTSKIFDLFFDITSDEGYHPSPSGFNFIFTITTGAVLGTMVCLFRFKKSKK